MERKGGQGPLCFGPEQNYLPTGNAELAVQLTVHHDTHTKTQDAPHKAGSWQPRRVTLQSHTYIQVLAVLRAHIVHPLFPRTQTL